MFSTTPIILCFSCLAATPAFVATLLAAKCGVVTIITSASGTIVLKSKAISPVPGGESITI